ncbi:hypothetical protein GLOTRDRAFT_38533 [Gloeophyllum trabeum ATCC 11539]|uniref:Adenylate kinase n=1 Tax=Gloeophyllum trabeum (strain ATCC 11539 / FP-39264 / Madison 617) TaxID=670483 RepID=S7RUI1_GLOTA|nr:uncharacterized protein GLOTRDRAFT_38533 [Gloeophyllum trabeum ATCC 11539]EPQ56859.1 hypothetical protein GLOTRDRAFT_38533 [Gloeophyllum trabeum ATCC 11539]
MQPLNGDGQGRYKVHIVGNSGTEIFQSTLGAELAQMLRVPYIPLDTLFWEPGWKKTSVSAFRAKVRRALDQAPNGWVVDGDYSRRVGDLVDEEATDIVWLDPPLLLYFPRLCVRTVFRLLSLRPPCSPGCEERVREAFFSTNSILWWCLSQHWTVRKRERTKLREDAVEIGGKRRRIGGWGRELLLWKRSVEEMLVIGGVTHSQA